MPSDVSYVPSCDVSPAWMMTHPGIFHEGKLFISPPLITWWGVHQYPQNDFRYVHYSTDVFTLVFSCAVSLEWSDLSSHNVAYMLVWLLVYSYKKFSISKISLDFKNSKPKCVSGHSEQLWFLNPPQGSTWAQTDPKIPLPHFGHKHPVHFISF